MPGKQAKVVTPPMLKRMLRRVSRSTFPARDRAMILLSIKAGLRACEIAGLDWSMVLDAQGHVSGRLCHVAVPQARRVGALGIVRPLRPRSATWPSRQREVRDVFELRRDGVEH
jgi:integrase/recombinase XerD